MQQKYEETDEEKSSGIGDPPGEFDNAMEEICEKEAQ